jgi:hypothetical protein
MISAAFKQIGEANDLNQIAALEEKHAAEIAALKKKHEGAP